MHHVRNDNEWKVFEMVWSCGKRDDGDCLKKCMKLEMSDVRSLGRHDGRWSGKI